MTPAAAPPTKAAAPLPIGVAANDYRDVPRKERLFSIISLMMMNISIVEPDQKGAALALLQKASLPVDDIDDKVVLFELHQESKPLGVIGLESNGRIGLLRSLCVDARQRGKGYGEALVDFLEKVATQNGLRALYLLTTSAESFFARRNYEVVKRESVPEFIQQTKEFSSLCPSSAVVMKKDLPSPYAD